MLTREQEEQFQQIFAELGKSLDITKAQYDAAVTSYEYLGSWLDREGSPLAPYRPVISPQGSLLLGTSIRPIHEDDDFDVDLVLRLIGKPDYWTQKLLKQVVGRELEAHGTFKRQLQPEGRRCWTLKHADGANFHMDILPAVTRPKFNQILNKALTDEEFRNAEDLVFSITDNKELNYAMSTNALTWPQSNPFGYAIWFKNSASVTIEKARTLFEAIEPIPAFKADKLPLQRIVQILKRHRDTMFNGDDDKPISIILTTLAARAYQKETNILVGLTNVLNRFEDFIETRWDGKRGKAIKWIVNPVNDAENFADKWPDMPQREQKFYQWLRQIKKDIARITDLRGLHRIQEGLSAPFGDTAVNRAFSVLGQQALHERESGLTRMSAGTGMLGTAGRAQVGQHNDFGANE
jgi:hypothetical protein